MRTELLREVDTRYGRMVVPDVENDLVSRFLVEYGEWAELEVEFLARILPDGAAVADIGASIGTFGLALGRGKKLSSICFVEGNPEIVPLLIITKLEQYDYRGATAVAVVMLVLSLPAPFHGSDKVLGYGLALAALWYFGGLLWRLRKGTAGVKPVEALAGPQSPAAQDR